MTSSLPNSSLSSSILEKLISILLARCPARSGIVRSFKTSPEPLLAWTMRSLFACSRLIRSSPVSRWKGQGSLSGPCGGPGGHHANERGRSWSLKSSFATMSVCGKVAGDRIPRTITRPFSTSRSIFWTVQSGKAIREAC